MKLRQATTNDVDYILKLVEMFSSENVYLSKNLADAKVLRESVSYFVTSPDYLALVWDGGVFIGGAVNMMFGRDPVATEILLFVDPAKRGHSPVKEVLERLEAWAKERELTSVVFHLLGDNPRGDFLTRAGYKLCEASYVKEI